MLQEKLQATSIADVDTKLREFGSSLAKQEQAFFESVVAREWLRSNVEFREEVTHDELLNQSIGPRRRSFSNRPASAGNGS